MTIQIKFFTRQNTFAYNYLADVPEKLSGIIKEGDMILVNSERSEIALAKVVSLTLDPNIEFRTLDKTVLAILEPEKTIIVDESSLMENKNRIQKELETKIHELRSLENKISYYSPKDSGTNFATEAEKKELDRLAIEIFELRKKLDRLTAESN